MGSLFKKPKAPVIPAPAPMPLPVNEDELMQQRKRREKAAASKSGRSATILSDAAQTNETYG